MDILFQSTATNPHLLTVSIAVPYWTPVGIFNTKERHLTVYGNKEADIAPAISDALNMTFTVSYGYEVTMV